MITNLFDLLKIQSKIIKLSRNHEEWFKLKYYDLILSGFPRSGNTYFKASMKINYPQLKINESHIHHKELFVYTLRKKIPTVILIRNPVDAISSYIVYLKGKGKVIDIKKIIDRYNSYYSTLHKYKNNSQLIILDFNEMINSLEETIKRLNNQLKFNLEIYDNYDENQKTIFKKIYERNLQRDAGSKMTVHLPNEEKKIMKDQIIKQLGNQKYSSRITHSIGLYKSLILNQ